jgi:hypothetical protein
MKRLSPGWFLAPLALWLAGCAGVGVGVGISVPLPGVGSVGVSGSSDGRVSGGVSVGTGNVRVDVGASGRLPRPETARPAEPAASAASAPARP